MNPDFKLIPDNIKVPVKGKKNEYLIEAVLRLTYKGEPIARWQGRGEECDLYALALKHIKTQGYLAEWQVRWALKMFEPGTNWVQWNDSLFVDINVARREKPRMRKDSRGKWLVLPGDNWQLFIKAWTWAQTQ